jgi:hypothetical protein
MEEIYNHELYELFKAPEITVTYYSYVCDYRRGLDWWTDLLTTYWT